MRIERVVGFWLWGIFHSVLALSVSQSRQWATLWKALSGVAIVAFWDLCSPSWHCQAEALCWPGLFETAAGGGGESNCKGKKEKQLKEINGKNKGKRETRELLCTKKLGRVESHLFIPGHAMASMSFFVAVHPLLQVNWCSWSAAFMSFIAQAEYSCGVGETFSALSKTNTSCFAFI